MPALTTDHGNWQKRARSLRRGLEFPTYIIRKILNHNNVFHFSFPCPFLSLCTTVLPHKCGFSTKLGLLGTFRWILGEIRFRFGPRQLS